MKTVGIICEYNPFHLGHARQFRLIREVFGPETAIVCVMSGNYVQRGEPAMWDKFTRAKAAVACGADVVLELPITGVLQSAEGFARSGVEILTRFGVEYLCFGAECGDADLLMELAKRMDTAEFAAALRDRLDQGLSYAAARQAALGDENDLLSKPNNILGLEYCRVILSLGSPLIPFAIRRTGDYHAVEADWEAPSATAVRKLFPAGNWKACMPDAAAQVLDGAVWYEPAFGERAVLARLRGMTDAQWEACAHGSEGLWSKAMKAARRCSTVEDLIQALKSKRYPRTRIQRLLLCAYLGITAADLQTPLPYSRILAFSDSGRPLIRQAKNRGELTLINPGQPPENREYYALETRAADLFTLFAPPDFDFSCQTEQNARLF